MKISNESKANILARLRTDPIYHIEKIQGIRTLEEYQKRVILCVAEHERTAVKACHDVGKTFLASTIVAWFTSVFKGAKVITTAPTHNQVKRLLWSEIRARHANSAYPLGGEMLLTEWKISEDWFAVGFTSRAEKSISEGQGGASSFQGFHAPAILVIFDEATGISSIIWKQLEGLMTSAFVRFLAIGNPTTKACEFFSCFSSPAYKKITLSCFHSPNFQANGIHNMEDLQAEVQRMKELSQDEQYLQLTSYKTPNVHLLTVKWVIQMILKWGFQHPLVVSKCFGEFPEEDEHTLIPLGVVQTSQFRSYIPQAHDRVSIGVDVARFGSDKTVITKIKGLQVIEKKTKVKRDTVEISGEIINMLKDEESKDVHIAIDATGIGSGVVDNLKEAKSQGIIPRWVEIRECHFGGAPTKSKQDKEKETMSKLYVNLKARIYVELSNDLKDKLCLLEEDVYLEEFPTIRYKFDSKGRWQIESKEEYKSRTGRSSPDDADSLALANYARYDDSGEGEFTEKHVHKNSTTIVGSARNRRW